MTPQQIAELRYHIKSDAGCIDGKECAHYDEMIDLLDERDEMMDLLRIARPVVRGWLGLTDPAEDSDSTAVHRLLERMEAVIGPERRKHKCMRCGGEFDCTAQGCVAGYMVLPRRIASGPDGQWQVIEHDCVGGP